MAELALLRLFGAIAPRATAGETSAAALTAFGRRPGVAPRVCAGGGFSLATAAETGNWLAHKEGLAVAICGRPDLSSLPLRGVEPTADPALRLLAAYGAEGSGILHWLHGSFALAVVEIASRKVFLAIDRMGIEAMCFATSSGGLVFGTRADTVATALDRRPEIDPQAVFDYLFFHMVPAPETIFRGVSKLLPGQYFEFHDGRTRLDFYWRMSYVDQSTSKETGLASRFRDLLPKIVSRQLGDEPVGTFLSGGTDSTTVTGTLARLHRGPVDAYSIGFDAPGFDEMEYARIAARHFDVRHHPYYLTADDVVEAVPLIARAHGEPFGNASAVPTYYCARRAREEGISALLAGDGGDEIFGGNARYAKQQVFQAYEAIPGTLRRNVLEPLVLNLPGAARLAPTRKLQRYVSQARVPLPDRLETYNFLVQADLAEVFEPDFLTAVRPENPFLLMRDAYERAASTSPLNRMMHLDLKQTLADNDLRKVNVACRLAGIDVRYPMLDDEMVALSGEVPPSGKVRVGRLRPFFKDSLRDFLPPEILAKEKHGFGLPFGVWLHDHKRLYELACDSATDFKRRGFLRPAYIDGLLSDHQTGHASYYGVMVWVVMMIEQWLQVQESTHAPGTHVPGAPR